MVKTSIMALIFIVIFAFVGCGEATDNNGSEGTTTTATNDKTNDKKAAGYVMSVSGTEVAVNALMAPIVEALGEPDKYFESESCAFQGLDKVYTYGSVVITTYPENNVDYVYSIELKDDTVSTKEGLYIGATKDEVVNKYGTATKETDVALVYEKDGCQLAFILDGDSVKNITYTAITE